MIECGVLNGLSLVLRFGTCWIANRAMLKETGMSVGEGGKWLNVWTGCWMYSWSECVLQNLDCSAAVVAEQIKYTS